MKIKKVNLILNDSNMQDKECNFKIISKGPKAPAWFTDWVENVYKKDQVLLISRMDQFEHKICVRIDNLVKKNNLVE